MRVVLFEPEIPPNTGNIARLCAATGVPLDLIEPLGFRLENRYLRRAGLDYWPNVDMHVWPDWKAFLDRDGRPAQERLVMTSSKRENVCEPIHTFSYTSSDCLIFGPETRGLPREILDQSPLHIRIPMRPDGVRSINLSTCVGIVLYQALISCGIPGSWI